MLLNLVLASLLFSDYVQIKTAEETMTDLAYMLQFPGPMSEVILDQLTVMPLY